MSGEAPGEYQDILLEKRGPIATLSINRPEKLNACRRLTYDEIRRALQEFSDDPELRALIVTAVGERSFCVGSDVKDMAERSGSGSSDSTQMLTDRPKDAPRPSHRERIWKPMIAAVNGYCLGGGLELALSCDIIVAAEHASFGLPEIRVVGYYPPEGIHLLPRQIPFRLAMDMLLTGRRITAQEALGFGLINSVVPLADLMAAATAKAEEICENPPLSVRVTKEMVWRSLDRPLEYPYEHPATAWQLNDDLGVRIRDSEDVRSGEGPRAFAEKRKPVWKGR